MIIFIIRCYLPFSLHWHYTSCAKSVVGHAAGASAAVKAAAPTCPCQSSTRGTLGKKKKKKVKKSW